jgi:PAS domain S-box-containing protein
VSAGKKQRLLIGAVSGGGAVALAAAWIINPPSLDARTLRLAALLVAVSAAAELLAIRLPHGTTGELITLFEAAVVADLVLLPPALGPVVAVAGLALMIVIRRRPLVKALFNLGQYAIAVTAASMCYQGLGGGSFRSAQGLLWLVVGMAAFTASNLVTISAIIASVTRRRLSQVVAEEYRLSLAMGLGNSAVGLVAVALVYERPELVPAVLAPALALHLAYRGWISQRQLVRVIQEEKTKLDRIIEHSSEGIVLVDAAGTVVLWSPSMARITGVPVEEANGKSVSYLLRGHAAAGEPMTVEPGGADAELKVVRVDGSERWLSLKHGPALDEQGALVWDVLLVHDVTRQREVERLKEDFVATVSHELRTPLTPIKGYAATLLRRDDIPPQLRRKALEAILERTDHMHRLVEDLLLVSRMGGDSSSPLPDVRREPVELTELAESALRGFRTGHPDREFTLSAQGSVVALGDATRLDQVLTNLVSNAIKFSPADRPVQVSVRRDGEHALLSVHDRGRGIPEDKLEEVFQKFHRLEDPNVMETGGAGLGLYIVRQLVTAMGGEVDVTSRLGEGSSFVVRLPLASEEPEAEVQSIRSA